MGSITRSFANLITANGPSAVADGSVTTADISGNINFKNIIINGDMSIAQRGTSASNVSTGYHTCDRWNVIRGAGTLDVSQETDAPTGSGFVKSFKFLENGSGASPSAGDRNYLQQRIEGQNLQYLKKGTSSAQQLTLSFWIKATVTGTYIAELFDTDNTRQVSKTYTVNSSNTWEYKTITFPADTTGAFTNDNGVSLDLSLYLTAGTDFTSGTLNTTWNSNTNTNRAVGQVNALASANDFVQITGVQLEAGTSASDFEFLPYDVNLQRCQRYYDVHADGSEGEYSKLSLATAYTNATAYAVIHFKQKMRAAPSLDLVSGVGYYRIRSAGVNHPNTADMTISNATTNNCRLVINTATTLTAGYSGWISINNQATGFIAFDAEL